MTTKALARAIPAVPLRNGRRTLRIGLLGLGTVGSGVVKILDAIQAPVLAQHGVHLELAGVAVLHRDKPRGVAIDQRLITDDAWNVVNDPAIDLIIEVIGGSDPAAALLRQALNTGHDVVSANKLVLAESLPAWHALARLNGVRLLYEAAVCGSIPVLRSLDHLRATDEITAVRGIVNGSTNFILTAMTERGISYDAAIEEARIAGFLEADPTLDVSGADAAQKLSILIYHAFGTHVPPSQIDTTGITAVTAGDIGRARLRGNVVKLVAVAERNAIHEITAHIRPEEVPIGHVFAATRNEFNTIELQTRFAGPQLLRGKGAGSLPTASAVVADVMAMIR